MSFAETKRKYHCRLVAKGTVRPPKTVRDSHQQVIAAAGVGVVFAVLRSANHRPPKTAFVDVMATSPSRPHNSPAAAEIRSPTNQSAT